MSISASVSKTMNAVREGASGWIDEHGVSDEAAEQLFRYIEAALDWQHEADVADADA